MAAKAGSRTEVDLGVGSDFGESRASPKEFGIAVSSTMVGFFPFTVTLLGAKSSSGSLEMAEPFLGFL